MSEAVQSENTDDNEEAVQYLTFTLDGEAFATEITKVREVLELIDITPVPRTSASMKGVINLRGNVVPVIDMRLQFGLTEGEVTVDTCIIIVEVNIDGHSTVLGALTDSVQEVVDLHRDQMEPAPTLGTRVDNSYIQAMGKSKDGKFIIVLNMDKVFSIEQISEAENSSEEQTSTSEIEAE